MQLKKIAKVCAKDANCEIIDTKPEGNMIFQWVGTRNGAYYPVEGIRLGEDTAPIILDFNENQRVKTEVLEHDAYPDEEWLSDIPRLMDGTNAYTPIIAVQNEYVLFACDNKLFWVQQRYIDPMVEKNFVEFDIRVENGTPWVIGYDSGNGQLAGVVKATGGADTKTLSALMRKAAEMPDWELG